MSTGIPTFRMQRLTETEIESAILKFGGARAHPDADKRNLRGADFIIGSSVIELKILEDEGLEKPERQRKLATLFSEHFPSRPTVVLDRGLLDEQGQRTYDRIMEGPIKSAVSSARQQLQQSRLEHNATVTVLWVINNGYSSLSHDALMELVVRRVKNDTREIDAVVVSGCYFYSDSFDSMFFWPIDHAQINSVNSFRDFETLQQAWSDLTTQRMNSLMRDPNAINGTKGPILDIAFLSEGVTFVLPTPPMGTTSDFYIKGRPRSNSTGITSLPPVATVFAEINHHEWNKFRRRHRPAISSDTFTEWKMLEAKARSESDLKPFLTIPITHSDWLKWTRKLPRKSDTSVHRYATDLFQRKILSIIRDAQAFTGFSHPPSRFMLLMTEEIGQDLAFDVSHLSEIWAHPDGNYRVKKVWTNKALFFEHALCIAAAEAISRGVDCVLWEKDKTYGWN